REAERAMDELLTYFRTRDFAKRRSFWLADVGYTNPGSTDFLINARTRRLLGTSEGSKEQASRRPLAVFVTLPENLGTPILDPLSDTLWAWGEDRAKRQYPPMPGVPFLPEALRPTAGGAE